MLEVVGFFRVFRVFRGSKCLEIFGKVLSLSEHDFRSEVMPSGVRVAESDQ